MRETIKASFAIWKFAAGMFRHCLCITFAPFEYQQDLIFHINLTSNKLKNVNELINMVEPQLNMLTF